MTAAGEGYAVPMIRHVLTTSVLLPPLALAVTLLLAPGYFVKRGKAVSFLMKRNNNSIWIVFPTISVILILFLALPVAPNPSDIREWLFDHADNKIFFGMAIHGNFFLFPRLRSHICQNYKAYPKANQSGRNTEEDLERCADAGCAAPRSSTVRHRSGEGVPWLCALRQDGPARWAVTKAGFAAALPSAPPSATPVPEGGGGGGEESCAAEVGLAGDGSAREIDGGEPDLGEGEEFAGV